MFSMHEKVLIIKLVEEKLETTIKDLSQTKNKILVDFHTERIGVYKELLEKVLED